MASDLAPRHGVLAYFPILGRKLRGHGELRGTRFISLEECDPWRIGASGFRGNDAEHRTTTRASGPRSPTAPPLPCLFSYNRAGSQSQDPFASPATTHGMRSAGEPGAPHAQAAALAARSLRQAGSRPGPRTPAPDARRRPRAHNQTNPRSVADTIVLAGGLVAERRVTPPSFRQLRQQAERRSRSRARWREPTGALPRHHRRRLRSWAASGRKQRSHPGHSLAAAAT